MPALFPRDRESTIQVLSYLGLIPFVAGAGLAWAVGDDLVRPHALASVYFYGAVILSFIGAMHWGRVLVSPQEGTGDRSWLVWGVAPSLVGWFALLLPHYLSVPLLIIGLGLTWTADHKAIRAGLFPAWYGQMRNRLTTIVSLTLASTFPLVF